MEPRIYWDVDIPMPERMTRACRDSNPSKQAIVVAHTPNHTKLLITALDEQTRSC